MSDDGSGVPRGLRRRIGLPLGPLLLAATLVVPPPDGLGPEGWHTAGAGLWMAAWWVSEAVPIPATALLPLVLFPVLGIADVDAAAAPFANPLIFLFLGGFLLALAMERWGLPRRIALAVVAAVGVRPKAVVAGFMLSAAFLSMWVSNTATAMIMLPIGVSVLELARRGEGGVAGEAGEGTRPGAEAPVGEGRNFGVALMLGIAYACSIGGLGTLVGTPPNAFLAAFFSEAYGVEVGFARWMSFGLPLVAAGLPIAYLVITRIAFPVRLRALPGGRELVRRERRKLGPAGRPERRVGIVFGTVALLWILRPLLSDLVPGLSDAGIAVAGGLALFLLPAGRKADAGTEADDDTADDVGTEEAVGREGRRGGAWTPLLRWHDAEKLPWGVLVLFGGGLSLASAIQQTGLTGWLGQATSGLAGYPLPLVIGVPVLVVILLTEITSNTATTAAFLPILASVAVGVGQDPRVLAVPAAVAASCAFMLPVATPPNAIVYGSGAVTVPEMARGGLILNLLFVVLVTAAAWGLMPLVLGVEFGFVPGWAAG